MCIVAELQDDEGDGKQEVIPPKKLIRPAAVEEKNEMKEGEKDGRKSVFFLFCFFVDNV